MLLTFVIQNTLNHLHQLIVSRESKSFLPQASAFVADDEDVEMIVLVVDKLANLFEREIDVRLIAGEEIPAGSGVQFFRIRLQTRRRINGRIDADGNE